MPMMMKKKTIILIPYPAQGHVTPMLKLASLLSNLNFQPVVITPEFIHSRISRQISPEDGILCFSIPDGLAEDTKRDFFAIEWAMEEYMPKVLEEVVLKMIEEDGGGVVGLVADLLASWAVEVARRCGVPAAGFWPAMHATYRLIAAIPELIQAGVISENGFPRNLSAPICFSPNEPILTSANDLPWLIGSSTARIKRFKFWIRTLERSKALRWILTNTFQNEYESKMTICSCPNPEKVFEIGPLIMQAATISTSSFWEEDMSCLGWLDEQNVGSVLYISFGSWVSPIGEDKVRALALTLEALGRPFIWVLGPTWRRGLPNGYAERVATHGRIVSWAPQVEVLGHPTIGCYLTHCGWNSTIEAIQCKKTMLCYPIAGDQFVNCAYIVDAWKIGVKIEGFGIEEVEDGVRRVMEDEEVNSRIEKLNEKLFGKEISSKAMTSLSTFIQELVE
ncbi:UDP-glucuronosyl and UDP-glucosyl transferase [Handroanthus impetiginosus]|uniref:UDP-glucuronosyl and UDP-glucosyl transferase n=1 Tax=Handroanthus impetiginosus TaxID=429701 RepID=A0A2G9HIV8_9LAMI|nr:UDP-glucuronosyl and UDP-glucosyl transferase [Handroanthus impetiginosus]